MSTTEAFTIDGDILARVVNPDQGDLPLDLAQAVLRYEFAPADRRRMHELAEKSSSDTLTERERDQMEAYIRVGHFLSLLKSKARVSLRNQPAA